MKINTTTCSRYFKSKLNFILKNKLCYKNGEISNLQHDDIKNIEGISLAFGKNNEPIGCCISYKKGVYNYNFSVFVSAKHRKKGIGTELVKKLLKRIPNKRPRVCKNNLVQKKFYNSLGM